MSDRTLAFILITGAVGLVILILVAVAHDEQKEDCQDHGGHIVKDTECPIVCTLYTKYGCAMYQPVCDWHCEGATP